MSIALDVAALNGQTAKVQRLIADGVEIKRHPDALRCAAEKGHFQIVKLLIDKKADVDSHKKPGDTALFVAAREGHSQIVQLLIDKGATVNCKAKDAFTALHGAAQGGHDNDKPHHRLARDNTPPS
jgi:serine/threonine-protein phosphatase 6 regulatory ankyrin repeat subunit B